MTTIQLTEVSARNAGDAREWAICDALGVKRDKHDASRYDKASDVSAHGMNISVKSSKFSLMSGSLCEGREDFDGIWELYASRTHSDTFAYVTQDWVAYMMNLDEFKRFVYTFCIISHESQKNGGYAKIACRKESKKMLRWLAEAI